MYKTTARRMYISIKVFSLICNLKFWSEFIFLKNVQLKCLRHILLGNLWLHHRESEGLSSLMFDKIYENSKHVTKNTTFFQTVTIQRKINTALSMTSSCRHQFTVAVCYHRWHKSKWRNLMEEDNFVTFQTKMCRYRNSS